MKKALSLLLSIVMVFSLLPLTAFAAEGETTISFETTFAEGMQVGDTFTVTGYLANNPGMCTMTLSLKWNDEVVKFTGFATEYDEESEEELLVTDVFKSVWTPEVNHELGIIVAYRAKNTTKEGALFVANFEVIGSGELGLGLKDTDATEFEMANADMEDIAVTVDYSAISGLSVAAPEAEGPVIPDGAPFTAITTDAGAIVDIEDCGTVSYNSSYEDVPYYHVYIPEEASEIYVTHPISEDPMVYNDFMTGKDVAAGYYADTADWSGEGISFMYESVNGGYVITIPVIGEVDSDWDGVPDAEVEFIADEYGDLYYAAAVERNDFSPICFFTFEYGTAGGEEETTYNITVQQTTGGTVTVYNESMEEITEAAAGDYIFVDCAADNGYSFKQLYIDGEAVELGMTNGFYQMPAKDVTISAVFELIPPTTYAVTVNETTNGTVTADKITAAAGDQVTLTVTPESGYELDSLTVKQGETEIEVNNNAFTMPAGAVTVSASFKKVVAGYRFATSADVTAENGGTAVVHVKITGHSDETVTSYNAYDVTLTFDSDKLEYQGYDGAVKSDGGSVTVNGNTIRIVGCGADKDFGTEIATLTFKTKAEGEATVTIDKVQVSDKEESVKEDAPEATPKHDEDDTNADETPDVSIVVVPYSVTKPGFIFGNDKILHGETYTFSYTDTTNYTYTDLTVKVGGVEVTPDEENGVYTIENVTGAVVITATQTPNSYDVTKPENVEGPDQATYGEDYIFTVTPSKEDMAIDTVVVTDAQGNDISYTVNEKGEYVIAGTEITGAFTITVTEKEKMTTITFSGIEEDEIDGGKLTMAAEIGKDFTFKLIKKEGFDYTVKVGETELTESEETAGQYTIPAELVVKGGVAVTVEKVDNTTATIDVAEYINLDGKTMFLVTAKWGDKVLAYGEEGAMFWSDKYTVTGETEAGAYCWLVVSTDEMNTVDLVKDAAETAIVEAAEGATATAVKYNYDINGTTKVDVNDAQLAYDMYNASYMEFTENLPMLKFLEADMETDSKLDTKDVAAIISYIVSGTNA